MNAEQWNAEYPVGTLVDFKKPNSQNTARVKTRSTAWDADGTAVVKIASFPGAIPLDLLTPVTDVPAGERHTVVPGEPAAPGPTEKAKHRVVEGEEADQRPDAENKVVATGLAKEPDKPVHNVEETGIAKEPENPKHQVVGSKVAEVKDV